jgi:hypothetical protein
MSRKSRESENVKGGSYVIRLRFSVVVLLWGLFAAGAGILVGIGDIAGLVLQKTDPSAFVGTGLVCFALLAIGALHLLATAYAVLGKACLTLTKTRLKYRAVTGKLIGGVPYSNIAYMKMGYQEAQRLGGRGTVRLRVLFLHLRDGNDPYTWWPPQKRLGSDVLVISNIFADPLEKIADLIEERM